MSNLKSSFDLAMERMAKRDGGVLQTLSDAQKEAIADVGRKTTAKVAELEILFRGKIAKAREANDEKAALKHEETMQSEIRKLRAKEDEQKEAVRRGDAR